MRQLQLSPWLASVAIGKTIPLNEGGILRTGKDRHGTAGAGRGPLWQRRTDGVPRGGDALTNEQILNRRLEHEQRALACRSSSPQIGIVQHQAGSRGLLWVERLQTEQLAVEKSVIMLRDARIASRILLHLALGGIFDVSTPVAALAGGE